MAAGRPSSRGRRTVAVVALRVAALFPVAAGSTPARQSPIAAALTPTSGVWPPHESSSNLQQMNSVDRSRGWLLDERSCTCRYPA